MQVPVRPAPSVTVKTTVLAPNCAQVKPGVFRLKPKEPIEVQLSFDPLLIAAAVVLPFPAPSNVTVTFWQTAVGSTKSATVMTIALLVAVVGRAHGSLDVTSQVMASPVMRLALE